MSREYEVVYIIDSALEEAQVTELLDGIHALLKAGDAENPITDIDHWGKRTLAYPIKGHEVGYYAIAHFEVDPQLLPEYERALKLNNSVLRYLVVLNEGAKPVPVPSPNADENSDSKRAE